MHSSDVPGFYGYDVAIVDLDLPNRLLSIIGIDGGQVIVNSPGACPFQPESEGRSALGAP